MKSLDTLKQELDAALKSLRAKLAHMQDYSAAVQGAITHAAARSTLAKKNRESEIFDDNPDVASPIAYRLLRLAELGSPVWADPLKEMAREAEELTLLVECIAPYRMLLNDASQNETLHKRVPECILAVAETLPKTPTTPPEKESP